MFDSGLESGLDSHQLLLGNGAHLVPQLQNGLEAINGRLLRQYLRVRNTAPVWPAAKPCEAAVHCSTRRHVCTTCSG